MVVIISDRKRRYAKMGMRNERRVHDRRIVSGIDQLHRGTYRRVHHTQKMNRDWNNAEPQMNEAEDCRRRQQPRESMSQRKSDEINPARAVKTSPNPHERAKKKRCEGGEEPGH